MLRDRYDPMNLFALVPALGMELDPVLMRLDRLLDDDALGEAVKADLVKRHPRTATDGRPSTPVEVILRTLGLHAVDEAHEQGQPLWRRDVLEFGRIQCFGFCREVLDFQRRHPVEDRRLWPSESSQVRWVRIASRW